MNRFEFFLSLPVRFICHSISWHNTLRADPNMLPKWWPGNNWVATQDSPQCWRAAHARERLRHRLRALRTRTSSHIWQQHSITKIPSGRTFIMPAEESMYSIHVGFGLRIARLVLSLWKAARSKSLTIETKNQWMQEKTRWDKWQVNNPGWERWEFVFSQSQALLSCFQINNFNSHWKFELYLIPLTYRQVKHWI